MPSVTPAAVLPWTIAFFLASSLFAHTVALRLALLALGLALALWTVATARDAVHPVPPLSMPFALWAGWCVLSLFWSVEPDRTLKELRNEIFYAGLAFWICYIGGQTRGAARAIVPVTTIGVLVLCVTAFFYYLSGRYPRYHEGWHGGPGTLSSILLMVGPAVLIGSWYAYRIARFRLALLGLGFVPILFLAALTTFNRTIWYGFAAQLVILASLLAWRKSTPAKAVVKLVVGALAILIVAGATTITWRIHAERGQNDTVAALSADMRVRLWPEVLDHIKERPLTGYGFGRGLLRKSLDDRNQDLLWHAHNLLLEAMLQVGLPGVAMLLVLLAATLRETLRTARSADDLIAACGLVATGVVTGMLIRNMTDMLWARQSALVYWGLLGVLFAFAQRKNSGG